MKLASLGLLLGGALASAKQPNILFVLTDDQDLHMNSVDYMPLLQVTSTILYPEVAHLNPNLAETHH